MRKLLNKFLSQQTKNKFHKFEANLACIKHHYPSRNIKVIGVTGTKGKTSVANLIASIFDSAGIKCAMETTINTKFGDEVVAHTQKDRWVTTPPPDVLQGFLRKAVNLKCEYAIIEVTSQAIDQNRIWGIDFDTLIFTNLSHDHLDYHKTRENYLNAKLKVFQDNPRAKFIINADDPVSDKFIALPSKETILYSIKKPVDHGAVARKILTSADSVTFTIAHDDGQNTINLKIPGIFNVQNALASFCAGLTCGIDPDEIRKGLESVELISGRMEAIKVSPKQDFTVIVDYAHNPDSLKNVYETIKDGMKNTGGRLIAVLGATGRRDKTKRPLMGALAGKYADLVIFTDEDPYDENPEQIIEEVSLGIHKGARKKHQWRLHRNYWKVLDRKQAIKKAISEAKKNDVVAITGKGAEEVMAVGISTFIPFSDRKIARSELEEIYKINKT